MLYAGLDLSRKRLDFHLLGGLPFQNRSKKPDSPIRRTDDE